MFKPRDRQTTFLESTYLLPEVKAERLRGTWAQVFRENVLPLIDERAFSQMYCADNGRPNRPVETIVGVLVLKEWFNLTDQEALEQLEFSLQWHHALMLEPEEAHLCQKTLHNFRQRLMEHDGGKLAFRQMTDNMLGALGIRTDRQRLDSTHIVSNIALLSRLGLFCETVRSFIRTVDSQHPKLGARISQAIRGRYIKEDGHDSVYADARSEQGKRRLGVCARDTYRLLDLFRDTEVAKIEKYRLLERLFREQCEVNAGGPEAGEDDDDHGEGGVPVRVRAPKEVRPDSLQSPHDPEATYSAHKGKGYEVQVAETCHPENPAQMITNVEVTPSAGSDAHVTIPTLRDLQARHAQPRELLADTTYGSASNAVDAARMGTELVSPVAGTAHGSSHTVAGPARLSSADFRIEPGAQSVTVCPAGHEAVAEFEDEPKGNRVTAIFSKTTCEQCASLSSCPVKYLAAADDYIVSFDLKQRNLEERRRQQAGDRFHERYRMRAGIEATHSELKRKHGLGKLRVRRGVRVKLAVFLKALACNVKRFVNHLLENTERAAATA